MYRYTGFFIILMTLAHQFDTCCKHRGFLLKRKLWRKRVDKNTRKNKDQEYQSMSHQFLRSVSVQCSLFLV